MKSSKWSLAAASSSKRSSTSSRGRGASTRREDEGGDAAQGDRGDRAQRPEPDPRRPQQLRLARGGQLADAAVAEHQLDPPRPGPRCCAAARRCRGCRSRSRRRSSARRCRRGSPSPARSARQLLVQLAEHGAAADLDQARSPGPPRAPRAAPRAGSARPVGQRRLGEGVAGTGDARPCARPPPRRQTAAASSSTERRLGELGRPAGLVAGPVPPLAAGTALAAATHGRPRLQVPAARHRP